MLTKNSIKDLLENVKNVIFGNFEFLMWLRACNDDFLSPKMKSLMYLNVLCTSNDPHRHYMDFRGIHKFSLYFDLQICGIPSLQPTYDLYSVYMGIYGCWWSQVVSELSSPSFAVTNSANIKHIIQYFDWKLIKIQFSHLIFNSVDFSRSTSVDLEIFFNKKHDIRRIF